MARSDRVASDSKASLASSFNALQLEGEDIDSAISVGEGLPTFVGLYHRQQRLEIHRRPSNMSLHSAYTEDARSISSRTESEKNEKGGWMKGDLVSSRSLIVYANPSPSGGVVTLDLRKDGFVDGLGSWRITASADCVSVCIQAGRN